MSGATKLWASINICTASVLVGTALLRTRSLALPIGIHSMANTTQGIILGFGVSGLTKPKLLKPMFRSRTPLLTGGQFGLEASLPGLLILLLMLILLPRLVVISKSKIENAVSPQA